MSLLTTPPHHRCPFVAPPRKLEGEPGEAAIPAHLFDQPLRLRLGGDESKPGRSPRALPKSGQSSSGKPALRRGDARADIGSALLRAEIARHFRLQSGHLAAEGVE